MHFTVHDGPKGAQTILLSSGLGGSGSYWVPQIAALGGFRVVTYDHRGCGLTGGEVPEGTTIADMAMDLAEVMDASSTEHAHIVGHALGALIAMELALAAPSRVQSLLAINAWAKTSNHSLRCFEARLRLLDHVGVEAFVRAQPLFLYPAEWMERHADRMTAEDAHHATHFQGSTNLHRRVEALADFNIEAQLEDIRCPVLVLATTDDLLVPYSRSEALVAGLPNARLMLMDSGAHAVNVTEPDAFNDVMLRFLSLP